jgi:hypothetical protein
MVVVFVAATISKDPQVSTRFNRVDHNPFNRKYLKICDLLKSWLSALGFIF